MYRRANIENIRTSMVGSFVYIYVGLFCAYTCLFGLYDLHILVYTCEFPEHSFVRVCRSLLCIYAQVSFVYKNMSLWPLRRFGSDVNIHTNETYIHTQMRHKQTQKRHTNETYIHTQMRHINKHKRGIQMRPIYIHK